MFSPPDVDQPDPRAGDPRIGDLLGAKSNPVAVIVGFPSDRGVAINGGRVGAADGPSAIRNALYRLTPGSSDMLEVWTRITDLGDVATTGDVGRDQKALGNALGPYLNAAVVCIVLGGGHETAYGHFLAYPMLHRSVGIINIDAHADVRELVDGNGHSGSSFRQALEHPDYPAESYAVFGLGPHSCAESHLSFMNQRSTTRVWNHEASADQFDGLLETGSSDLMVTFDLDAFDQSVAPGVSAPTADGLSAKLGMAAAYSSGVSARVKSIDLSELNPRLDPDNRTARFGAMIVWHFVEGLTSRVGISTFLREG